MKKALLVIAIIALLAGGLFVLTGCGDNETTSNTGSNSEILQLPMNVINNVPDTTIKKLYLSGAGLDNWGEELLKGQEMPTGTQLPVTLGIDSNNVKWDIKAVDEEGTEVTFRNLDLSEVSTQGGTITLAIEDGTPVAVAQ